MSARVESFALSPRAALWLKLAALAAMVLDHLDTGLYGAGLGFHHTVGRAVFPIFAFLLAYNLDRAPARHLLLAVAPRMALFGVAAILPAYWLWGIVLPLNVMFSLALATAVVAMLRLGWWLPSAALAVLLGPFVDYGWLGVLCVVLGWSLRSERLLEPVLFPVLLAVLLVPVNGSWWALLAAPAILAASRLDGDAPRLKWLFYAVYPAHLVVLASIARVL